MECFWVSTGLRFLNIKPNTQFNNVEEFNFESRLQISVKEFSNKKRRGWGEDRALDVCPSLSKLLQTLLCGGGPRGLWLQFPRVYLPRILLLIKKVPNPP